jgi:type I restriction enzyme M protein
MNNATQQIVNTARNFAHVLRDDGLSYMGYTEQMLKTNPLRRADQDEFVQCFGPENRHERKATWSAANPDGRWRAFDYEELAKRDKLNLDIFWLKDRSLEESENLPDPEVLAQEIADDLQTALDQINAVLEGLKR